MSKRKELHECDYCGKDFEELHCQKIYIMSAAYEWLCDKCYEDKHGHPWGEICEAE